jgi:hypothetical protein
MVCTVRLAGVKKIKLYRSFSLQKTAPAASEPQSAKMNKNIDDERSR